MEEQNGRETISAEELFFFDGKPAALPMYEVFGHLCLPEFRGRGLMSGKRRFPFSTGICLPLFHLLRSGRQRIVRIRS